MEFSEVTSSAARLRKRKAKIETIAERIVTMSLRYGRLVKITSRSQADVDFEQGQAMFGLCA
jgi:hypothetical protein